LLDDQPVDTREDRLRLTRYLDIIDQRVLHKDDSLLSAGRSRRRSWWGLRPLGHREDHAT